MSLRRLCDHRAIVYRAVTTRDVTGDVIHARTPLPTPAGMNCRPNQAWSGALQDRGPGLLEGAARQWYLLPCLDAAEGDILRVTAGPEAPVNLRIVSVTRPTSPTGVHHLEVNVVAWPEELP